MKLVIDIKGEPKKDDILIFDGNQYKPISKDEFLFKTKKELEDIKKEFEKLKEEINVFKEGVNHKLKDYHNILQTLTKED